MKDKSKVKMIVAILIIVIVGAGLFTIGGDHFSNPETYEKTIQTLDEKRDNVLAMTGVAAGVSTGLSALPNDMASPIANRLADLTGTFMLILGAIYLEKYLLTLTGMVAFQILVPVICMLLVAFLWSEKKDLLKFVAKLALFGICIVALVPTSTYVVGFIEDTQAVSATQNIEEAKAFADQLQDKADDEDFVVKKWLSKLSGGARGILEEAEAVLGNFIDAAALMVITSCVIPVLVLMLFLWLIRIILGIDVNLPTEKILSFTKSGHRMREKMVKSKNEMMDKVE